MTFSFGSLNLSNVTASSGVGVLQPGRYIAVAKEAEIVQNKAKTGHILKVKFVSEHGVITENINVQHTSKEAERIGLEQLKALLECGGHEDPSNPGGVEKIRGLRVGLYVAQDGVYEGKPQFKVKGFMKPEEVTSPGPFAAATGTPAAAAIGTSKLPF
jgi:hypothetical protein